MIGIFTIITHHFRVFEAGKVKRYSEKKIVIFLAAPAALAYLWHHLAGPISGSDTNTFLTILAVVGSILTAMLAVVQAVIGFPLPGDNDEPYRPIDLNKFRKASSRLTTLRELYANIAYSVLLIIIALPMFLVTALNSCDTTASVASSFVYFVCTTLALTFFYIISGVYLVLDEQGQKLSDELEKYRPK